MSSHCTLSTLNFVSFIPQSFSNLPKCRRGDSYFNQQRLASNCTFQQGSKDDEPICQGITNASTSVTFKTLVHHSAPVFFPLAPNYGRHDKTGVCFNVGTSDGYLGVSDSRTQESIHSQQLSSSAMRFVEISKDTDTWLSSQPTAY